MKGWKEAEAPEPVSSVTLAGLDLGWERKRTLQQAWEDLSDGPNCEEVVWGLSAGSGGHASDANPGEEVIMGDPVMKVGAGNYELSRRVGRALPVS